MQFNVLGSPIDIDESLVDEPPADIDAHLRGYARGTAGPSTSASGFRAGSPAT